jgi:sugar phosphate isomerase/epimerase
MGEKHKLGVCTWMFGELPLSETARRLGQLGFDGVELMGSLDLYQPEEAGQILTDHGLAFVGDVGADNVGILLEAYHMNIEELDPADALRQAADRLWLYHAADSNRQGIGRGHTDFYAQLAALHEINYSGPMILECTAPGPDPFKAIKDESSLSWLETYLAESRSWLLDARPWADDCH